MRPIRALFVFLGGAVISLTFTYALVVRPRIRAWGVDPAETDLALPGDDLVSQPSAIETRGLTVDAPVAKVWPYLIQMGFGRAGWYSYDALDNKGSSAPGIVSEFQQLKPGDIMPTHPGGGFLVKTVDFERALVLYTDTELVRTQTQQAQDEGNTDLPTPGLKASGAILNASFPEFAASWAFYLKPTEDGKTRLIERFRAKTPGSGAANVVLGEVMGTGIVLMTRKQMLGIKERVERGQHLPATFVPEPEAVPAL